MIRCVAWMMCLMLAASTAAAQDKVTEHTMKLAAGARSPTARIGDAAWLRGHWTGTGLGGFTEEIWNTPRGGVMLSMFQLIKDDKPVFYELVTLSERDGSLLLQLKHFDPDLTGWEARDERREFKLVALEPDTLRFDGITYELADADILICYVAIKGKDGTVREEKFTYRRAAGGG